MDAKKKTSISLISYIMRINRTTVKKLIDKVAEVIVPNYYKLSDKIGGNDTIIEIDESKFGRRKYHKGHHVKGVWVLGMVERGNNKRVKLFRIKDRTKNTLEQIINSNVKEDTINYTDCWKGYSGLKDLFKDHKTVNHSKHFKDPVTKVHTNTIEGLWGAVKRQTPIRNRTEPTIDLYLVRYMLVNNEADYPLKRILKYSF